MLKNNKIILGCTLILLCFLGAYIWYFPTNRLETVEVEEQVIVPDLIEEATVSELDLPELLPELKEPPMPLVMGVQKKQEVTVNPVKGAVTNDIARKKLNLVTSELKPLQTLPGINSTVTQSTEAKPSTKKKKTTPASKVLAAFEAETGISPETIEKAMNPQ